MYPFRILEVDLEREKFHLRMLDEENLRRFVGGVGVAAKILWDETTSMTEPLSRENPLIFMIGPLTGTDMPKSSRFVVVGTSPLTGIWGESHSGGMWGDELRHAGFEGLVFRGKSETPIYLWIRDGEVEIRNAEQFWGIDTYHISDLLRKETDEKASVVAIGPAGERLVRIAAIINDGRLGRAAARCGLGALMGFKGIKAIAVKGSQKIHVEDPEEFKKSVAKIYAPHPPPKTPSYLGHFVKILEAGGAPFKNWRLGTWERGYKMAKSLPDPRSRAQFCRHCPYSCSESRLTEDGVREMVWEHWGPVGLACLIDNKKALQEAYTLCNKYGIDTISTGETVSFAMECYEKGLITERDTGGIKLRWGDHRAMLEIVRKIGENEGFGKVLGEGVKRAAEQIGEIAHEYAIHVKGLSIPAHDPRAANARALCYATGNTGASHFADGCFIAAALENYPGRPKYRSLASLDLGYPVKLEPLETEGKAELAVKSQNFGCMLDSLVVCDFLFIHQFVQPSHLIELLNCVTGWDMTLEEFLTTGERIFNLKRMINVRRGVSRKDDTLPPRILTHKRGSGGAAYNLPFLGRMLNEYYQYRGWSEEGIPTKEKLSQLDLQELMQYGF